MEKIKVKAGSIVQCDCDPCQLTGSGNYIVILVDYDNREIGILDDDGQIDVFKKFKLIKE